MSNRTACRDREVQEQYLERSGQLLLFPGMHWRSEHFSYVEVARTRVPQLEAAQFARRVASRDLRLAMPRLRFFVSIELAVEYGATRLAFPPSPVNLHGITYGGRGEVWVKATLGEREMLETVAHELRHVAQYRGPSEAERGRIEFEREARRYGLRVAKRILDDRLSRDVDKTRSITQTGRCGG